jgi:protein-disulfide isomerase
MKKTLALMAVLAGLLLGAPSQAQTPAFSAAQQEALHGLIRQYILDNPEVILEALTIMDARQKQEAETRAAQAIVVHRQALERDPADAVTGNPNGDVTLVEFFDYRCGYCKQVAGAVAAAVSEDGKVRLVHKQLPILGPASVLAARAAVAAQAQGRYAMFHDALMAERRQLDEAGLIDLAKRVGLDGDRLRRDMMSPETEARIQKSATLAQSLNIRGTPAFVIGGELIPGAVDAATLKSLIAKARKGG